jgi:hypothetical protein
LTVSKCFCAGRSIADDHPAPLYEDAHSLVAAQKSRSQKRTRNVSRELVDFKSTDTGQDANSSALNWRFYAVGAMEESVPATYGNQVFSLHGKTTSTQSNSELQSTQILFVLDLFSTCL